MIIGRIKIEPYGWMVIILSFALGACMSHGRLWGKNPTAPNAPCIPCVLLKSSSSNEGHNPVSTKSEKETSSKPTIVNIPPVKPIQSLVNKPTSHSGMTSNPSLNQNITQLGSANAVGSASILNGQNLTLDAVHFRHNSSRLDLDGRKLLDLFATNLQKNGSVEITIDGHADSTGKPVRNLRLSQRRAGSVKIYLASKLPVGVALHIESHGDTMPVGDNQIYDGRELNRRVELRVKLGSKSSSK